MKEGRKHRTLSRTVYSIQKRFLAFLLAAAMILTNIGGDINTVFAASSSESVIFSMSGSQLVKAIDEAIANGEEVTAEDLDFTNGKIAEFEKLFFGEGKIYEAYPEPEGGSMDAELRVFVRLPEYADNMYMTTGDEEIIFLYVNNGENTISCTTEITRMDNGVEKVKKTKSISVKSYEAAYGDEEVNVISKPAETTAPEEATAPTATTAPEETTAPAETESQAETAVPEETTAASAETQTGLPEETAETLEESQTEAPAEEVTEPETEAPAEDGSEAETTEPVASVIRHNVPVVAANENGDTAVTAEAPKETEAIIEEKATEAADLAETTLAPAEETTADSEITVPDTEETVPAPAESESAYEDESKAESAAETAPEVSSPSESKPAAETPEPEDKVSAAGTGDLVGIGYCSTAKAYVTTINQLKAFEDYEGYKISYAINPEASARIIEGPRGVEEGEALTFGVKNQIGYAVESVTANGENLTADSITDNEDATQTVWYSVPEIYEDQEVEVYMEETGEHPAFADSVTINGVTITATASEGVIPAGTKLDAKEVSSEIGSALKDKVEAEDGGQVTSVLAYDINLMLNGTKLDNSWSDNGYVTVTFSGSRIETETAEGSSVEIYAVDDTNAGELNADTAASATADTLMLESVGEAVDVSGGAGVSNVSFDAAHFTIYAIIVDGNNPAVATYNFYNGEGNLVNTQKVKNGETLVEPQIPTSANNNKFLGWSTNAVPAAYQEFGPVNVAGTQEINLYARFDQAYYVFFYNKYDVIQQIKQANSGQLVPVNDVTIDVLSDEALTGWSQVKGSQTSVGANVTITNNNINLYPIVQKVKWITYYANGGSYTSPAYVASGQNTVKPADPTRAGYAFRGWYTNSGLTTSFTFGNTLASDISLYAKWTPSLGTSYTVIHWKQNADDNGYSFAESESLTGTTEATTVARSKTYEGFTGKTITQKPIAGDGSTIVDVYYDRISYSIKFYKYSNWSWNELTGLRITAKFGANIKSQWPNSTTYPIWGTDHFFGNAIGPFQSGIDVMPKDGDQFYFRESSGSYTYKLNYYLEVLDGQSGISGYNSRKYNLDHTDTFKSNSLDWNTTKEDRYDIKGFTYSLNINDNRSFESQGSNIYKLDFYYYRNTYGIKFMNNGALANSISKQYEANIGDVSYSPPRPANVPSDYYFAGWYDNASFAGAAYSFTGKTMPAMNITFYAKWAAPQFNVTFDLNEGIGSYPSQTVDYGKTVPQPGSNPTKAGYTFAGWLLDGIPFNFNTQIYRNTNLVARWISTNTLNVVYDKGEGSGTVPVDSSSYVDGSRAAVRQGNTLTHSGGKVFIGWKLGEEVYYPGETFVVDSSLAVNNKVTLVAQWAALPASAFLTYHANFGGDDRKTVNVINNGTTEIAAGNTFVRDGYLFDRWTTEQSGDGSVYRPGANVLLDNIGSNDLYAQWIGVLSVSAANVTETYDGTGHGISPASVPAGAQITYKDAEGNYTLTESPTRTDVGTTTVEFKAHLYGYKDVTGSATVTIETRPVTITVNSASKNYGQQDSSLTFTGTIGDGDLIDKDDLGTITYGRRADDISKENVGDDITLTASYESNANYTVTIIPGKLTIVASDENAVVITGRQVTYDGSAYGLTDAHAVREGSTLLYSTDNATFTESAPTFTEAGVHVVYVKATNPNYSETAVVEGKVIINKRNIAFTAGSASKTYNGNPLTNNSTTVTSGTIVAGQTWTVKVTGSQTAVGTSKNVVSGAVINDGGRDVTANYDISYISGDLTVTSSGSSSGGGGGGGSSSGGGPNSSRPHTSGGPGDTTVTIDPGQIPLASLPEDNSATNLVLIDDGNIPLAGLPKTGDKAPVQGVAAIVSGLLLAAYMAFSRRRRDER